MSLLERTLISTTFDIKGPDEVGTEQEQNCTRKVSEESGACFDGALDCYSVSGLYGASPEQQSPLG